MRSLPCLLAALVASLCLLAVGSTAGAAPDASGSSDIQSGGFPGICDEPCFTATKSFEVYLDGNATVPAGANCPVGTNTYIYQIQHTGGTGTPNPPGFIPGISKFELAVETDDVSAAGFIPGFGINPNSTVVNAGADVIEWGFTGPLISNGQMSTLLFVCSALLPGNITDTMISADGQLALEAVGTCVGPLFEPGGEPLPCTIGFWKNRADGKKGTLKHFPGTDFDDVVTAAVALSGGIFLTEADLLSDLESKGNRPMEQRARQQFAAFLLNLAAGDLFPDNTKCKTFESNTISSNSCGSGITIGDALADFFLDYGNGDFEDAKNCADDTNNGIGVEGAGEGQ